jgi:hypothetical protein
LEAELIAFFPIFSNIEARYGKGFLIYYYRIPKLGKIKFYFDLISIIKKAYHICVERLDSLIDFLSKRYGKLAESSKFLRLSKNKQRSGFKFTIHTMLNNINVNIDQTVLPGAHGVRWWSYFS